MPFTFSHPAAVLPFGYLPKKWVSMTGLVIGSMAPDFEYFIRMKIRSSYSHTWAGLFWFDLPLTIALAFLFHLLVRNSLIENLPIFLKERFVVFKEFDWNKQFKKHWFVIIVSALIGTATHILWDNFTHRHGLFIQTFDGLKAAFTINGYMVLRFKVAQHLSTIVGGLIVIYAVVKLPRHRINEPGKSILPYWVSVSAIAFIITAVSLLVRHNILFEDVFAILITGMIIGLVLTPVIISNSFMINKEQ